VQESKHHNCVVIFPGDGHYVEVVVFVEVEKVVVLVLDEWFESVLVILQYLLIEDVVDIGG
jgi:hypothetical protein